MKPFRLLKASELRQLERRAAQAGATWAARWELHVSGPLIWTATDAGETQVAPDAVRHHAVDCGDGLQAAVELPAGGDAVLAALALGQSAQESGHAVASELALLCLADCFAEVTGLAEVRLLPGAVAQPSRGSGAALLCCRLEGRPLGALLLPLTLLQRMGLVAAAASPAPPAALGYRAAAVTTARLSLSATLADTSLTIKDLREIAVGDVVMLNHSLETPLTLRLGGRPAGRGYPGIQGGNLAVELSK
ncbi:FliM/FliN family flagellar motor switch protein [Solimonas sp. K1W22B-7]|uniref:FliM/FliN family flagellar motor C-terminal domain-containing protein n=1 Tax=Solimonas sp. K1W22B-7 TaxID=2303331 RepID=UPI000E3361E5|nr:FliM/FliN family flagellar motor C-terminal domain-containing protein [Solimonas sp. K1W22B-7]AXQ28066.1 FliM/FliN family flagellar motor switch protein [Solimonas sp. K1W22B-7]